MHPGSFTTIFSGDSKTWLHSSQLGDTTFPRRRLKISRGFRVGTVSGAPEWHGRGGRNVNILPLSGQFHMRNCLAQMPITSPVCFLEFSFSFLQIFPTAHTWFSRAQRSKTLYPQLKAFVEAGAIVSQWWDSKYLTTCEDFGTLNPQHRLDVSPGISFTSWCHLLLWSPSLYLTSFALNLFSPGQGPKSSSRLELSAYLKTVNGLKLPFLPQWL